MRMRHNATDGADPIDFVLLEGKFGSKPNVSDANQIRKWFRSVGKYAPWVKTVFFVSDGGWPKEAGEQPDGTVCVLPCDILPESSTASENGHAIQVNLHRIQGIAEQFVVFTPDQVFSRPSSPKDWFRLGLPVDTALLGTAIATYRDFGDSYVALNEDSVIQRRFGGRRFVLARICKWLLPWNAGCKAAFWNAVFAIWGPCPGFRPVSSPVALRKITMEDVWSVESELLLETTMRSKSDMKDLSIRLFRVWQFATGSFTPSPPSFVARRTA